MANRRGSILGFLDDTKKERRLKRQQKKKLKNPFDPRGQAKINLADLRKRKLPSAKGKNLESVTPGSSESPVSTQIFGGTDATRQRPIVTPVNPISGINRSFRF